MRVEARRCDGWIASRIDQTPHCLTRQASKGAPGPLEGPPPLSLVDHPGRAIPDRDRIDSAQRRRIVLESSGLRCILRRASFHREREGEGRRISVRSPRVFKRIPSSIARSRRGGDLDRVSIAIRPAPSSTNYSRYFKDFRPRGDGIFPEKGRGRNSKLVITRWRQPLAISSFVARSSVSSSARLSSQVAGGREGSSKKLASSYVRGYARLCAEWKSSEESL